jgi:dTDP-glucose 4,6-dehydratase
MQGYVFMTVLVTGGAGFIGSNFILDWFKHTDETIINLDKLSYAANLNNLKSLDKNPQHVFVQGDIVDQTLVSQLLNDHQPLAIIHFSPESHVDRSVANPDEFIHTNILGTYHLLNCAKTYSSQHPDFRFIHVSTDEVYGTLNADAPAFTESHPYQPNSPYSASKAASDHLVRSYFHTYGLPVITTNCSNNYGPLQYPEKLIPVLILNALAGKPLPIYGNGLSIRDWLHVSDHCAAIRLVLEKGKPGETYNIGGNNEKSNLDVVYTICEHLDSLKPRNDKKSYREQIQFVTDRPGHDFRYAINADKIKRELGWKPSYDFENGISQTIESYLDFNKGYHA